MKKILSLLILTFCFGASAQGLVFPNGVSTSGEVRVVGIYQDKYENAIAKVRLEVMSWAEGKIRVGMFLEETRIGGNYGSCEKASIHFLGVDNGTGSYDLYRDGKITEKAVGELILFNSSVSLNLFQDLVNVSRYSDMYTVGRCSILKLSDVQFSVVKPTCLNRRNKPIDCPTIEFLGVRYEKQSK